MDTHKKGSTNTLTSTTTVLPGVMQRCSVQEMWINMWLPHLPASSNTDPNKTGTPMPNIGGVEVIGKSIQEDIFLQFVCRTFVLQPMMLMGCQPSKLRYQAIDGQLHKQHQRHLFVPIHIGVLHLHSRTGTFSLFAHVCFSIIVNNEVW